MILADHICSKSNFASFRNVRLKNKTSGAKICIRDRDAVARKTAEHQVGGRSGVDVGWLERWESKWESQDGCWGWAQNQCQGRPVRKMRLFPQKPAHLVSEFEDHKIRRCLPPLTGLQGKSPAAPRLVTFGAMISVIRVDFVRSLCESFLEGSCIVSVSRFPSIGTHA